MFDSDQNTNPEQPVSLGKILLGIAAFGLLHKASTTTLTAASKFVARQSRRIIRQFADAPVRTGFASLQRRAYQSAAQQARRLGRDVPRRVDLTVGQLLQPALKDGLGLLSSSNMFGGKLTAATVRNFRQASAERIKYLRSSGLRGKELRQAIDGTFHPGDIDLRRKMTKNYFKADGGFGKRFMASAGKWAFSYAKSVPGFYIADQALGLFSQDPREDSPRFYDIPGHLAGMVRFGVTMAPMDIAFRGASRAARMGADRFAESAKTFLEARPGVREKVQRTLSQDGMLGEMRGYSKAFMRAYREKRNEGWGISIQPIRFDPSPYNVVDLAKRTVKYRKEIGKSNFGAEQEMKQILDSIQAVKSNPSLYDPDLFGSIGRMGETNPVSEAFTRALSKHTRAPKKNMLQHILGSPAKSKSTFQFIDEYAEKAGWGSEDILEIKKTIGDKRLYLGSNILESGDFRLASSAYWLEKGIEAIGRLKVPGIGWRPFERSLMQRKMGAFEVIDGAFLQSSETRMKGVDRVTTPHPSDVFLRVGDSMFLAQPYQVLDAPIKPLGPPGSKGRGKMLYLSSAEAAHLSTVEDIREDLQEKTGWLSHLRRKFEVGLDRNFFGGAIARWGRRDSNPYSAGVLVRGDNMFTRMIHSDEPVDFEKFGVFMDVIKGHLNQATDDAFAVVNRNTSLRNRVLDILGIPEAHREFSDRYSESMLQEMRHLLQPTVGKNKNVFDDKLNNSINRALGMFQTAKDPEYIWNSRASVLGESGELSVGEWLNGQYFKKLMVSSRIQRGGDFSERGTFGRFKEIFKTIEDAQISTREKVAMKAFLTGTSMDLSLAKLNTSGMVARQEVFRAERGVVRDHWSSLEDIFEKRIIGKQIFTETKEDNLRQSRALFSNDVQNRIFIFNRGNKNPTPGLINEFLNLKNVDQPVTEASILFNRWAIRPLNRTLATIGLDVSYETNAEFIKKFFFKRALAIPAAIYGYQAINTGIAALPSFDNTILDDGVTVFGADVIAKANLTRAGLFDSMGITGAAQYMEGLMPGSVESPAAKILRAAAPPILGRFLGGKSGFYAGLGISAATGFGLPDLTRTKEELEDVYSGKELVPVRKGRYWELCVAENVLIRTHSGVVKAKDLQKGSIVYNSYGDCVKVLDTSSRKLYNNEKVLSISTHVFSDDPLVCTEDHQVLVSRSDMQIWLAAKDLLIGDELVLPLQKFDDNLIKEESGWTQDTLYGIGYLTGSFLANGEIEWSSLIDGKNVESEKEMVMRFSQYVGNAIDTASWIEKIFRHDAILSIDQTGEYRVKTTDETMLQNFDVIKTKKIPSSFYHLGSDFRNGILTAIIQTCNDVDEKGRMHVVVTRTDNSLHIYLIDALLSIGIIPEHTLRTITMGTDVLEIDHVIIYKDDFKLLKKTLKNLNLSIPRTKGAKRKGSSEIKDGYLFHSISGIKTINYNKEVYDFWVSTGESFSGVGGVYHNSKGPFQGGKITSWVPSWYTRLKSQYRYTDAALGTHMESLLYNGPLAAVGITDPYHYERCVTKGTPILTSSGFKNVEHINVGDSVFTHEGTVKKVLQTAKEKIDEPIVSLYNIGFPSSTTVEHRYYARRGDKIDWIRADEITTKDYLRIPQLEFKKYYTIDFLNSFPEERFDSENLYGKTGAFSRYHSLNQKFGLICGLYLSLFQYSSDPFKKGVKNATAIEQKLESTLVSYFQMPIEEILVSGYVQRFMKKFGKPGSLQIPTELYMCNREFSQGLLKGLLEGKKLTWDVRDKGFVAGVVRLLLNFGIYADVQQSSTLALKFNRQQRDNLDRLFSSLPFQVRSDEDVIFTENYIELRVKKAIKERYRGLIYDIQIDGAYSFHGDCCVYHNTRFNERPYPLTSPAFHNVPILGPMLNATFGTVIKPQIMMHEDELEVAALGPGGGSYPQVMDRPQTYEGMFGTKSKGRTSSIGYHASESFYRLSEAVGLRGFLAQSLLNQEGPGTYNPTYEDASSITSHGKMFWDLQAGGMLGLSEGVRRLYPRSRTYNAVNPIRNTQPMWLPEEFRFGDAIGRLDNGLLLLPSRAYEKTHSIKHNFPLAVDYLGYDPREGALRYTQQDKGDLVDIHHSGPIQQYIQNDLSRRNLLVSKNVPVFDPQNLIEGEVDALVRMGDTDVPMQIKATTAERLNTLSRPLPAHLSQVNFFLRMMKKRFGQITYAATENPEITKTFTVEYNEERFKKDIAASRTLREMSMEMLKSGIGYGGESYSHPDRLMILANVAPWSEEYKQTLKKVQTLARHRMLDEEDQSKVNKAKRMRESLMRQYDMYPRRFAFGKIMTPDPEYNLMSENRHIKAAAEYSLFERILGGVWESFATTRIPFISRFYGLRTPDQAYEDVVYSSSASMWNHPIRDFAKPAATSFLSSDDPVEASRKGAMAGAFLGPPGMALGAGLGALYGTFSNGGYIPNEVKERRNLEEYFSAIKFVKGMDLYSQTGDPSYLQMARQTPFGLSEKSTSSDLYNSVPYKERPFLWAFAAIEDQGEREQVLKKVSPSMAQVLKFLWSEKKAKVGIDVEEYISKNSMPSPSWMGWNPNVAIEDVQMVTMRNEGMDSHDSGLGWKDQIFRMKNAEVPIFPIDISNAGSGPVEAVSPNEVRQTVMSILSSYGVRYSLVNVNTDGSNRVFVNLRVD